MSKVNSFLRNYLNTSYFQLRTYIKKPPVRPGGIKYPGFIYYPRHPDFKDPPYEPSKLFLITRLVKMKGRNCVEKQILKQLNIDGQKRFKKHITIVKNMPEINSMLWKVKHLISIVPIKFKNGLPKDGDFTGTYLRDTGEFIVSDKFKVEPEIIELSNEINNATFDYSSLRTYLTNKWNNGYDGDI